MSFTAGAYFKKYLLRFSVQGYFVIPASSITTAAHVHLILWKLNDKETADCRFVFGRHMLCAKTARTGIVNLGPEGAYAITSDFER
jgi:hypothetical protein